MAVVDGFDVVIRSAAARAGARNVRRELRSIRAEALRAKRALDVLNRTRLGGRSGLGATTLSRPIRLATTSVTRLNTALVAATASANTLVAAITRLNALSATTTGGAAATAAASQSLSRQQLAAQALAAARAPTAAPAAATTPAGRPVLAPFAAAPPTQTPNLPRTSRAASGAARSTGRLSRSSASATNNLRSLNRGAGVLNVSLNRLRTTSNQASIALASIGVGIGIFELLSNIKEFEFALSGVRAVTESFSDADFTQFGYGLEFVANEAGVAGIAMSGVERVARELGATTVFTATQAAEGMRLLSLAGFSAAEAMAAIPAVLDLAVAGNIELARSADIVAAVTRQFKLEADDAVLVVDAMAKTVTNANTTVIELGEALKFVGPSAAALGQRVEDVAAVLGVLGNAGVKASLGGTALRRIFVGLTESANAEKFKAFGIELEKIDPRTNRLVDIFREFESASLDLTAAVELFEQRGGPAAIALTALVDSLEDLTEKTNEATGTAAKMAAVMRANLAGDLKILTSVIQEATLSLGQDRGLTGALRRAAQEATQVARVFAGTLDPLNNTNNTYFLMADLLKGVAIGLAALAASRAFRVILVSGLGILQLIRSLVAGVAALSGGFAALRVAMAGTPWGSAITLVGLLTAGFIAMKTESTRAAAEVERLVGTLNDIDNLRKITFSVELPHASLEDLTTQRANELAKYKQNQREIEDSVNNLAQLRKKESELIAASGEVGKTRILPFSKEVETPTLRAANALLELKEVQEEISSVEFNIAQRIDANRTTKFTALPYLDSLIRDRKFEEARLEEAGKELQDAVNNALFPDFRDVKTEFNDSLADLAFDFSQLSRTELGQEIASNLKDAGLGAMDKLEAEVYARIQNIQRNRASIEADITTISTIARQDRTPTQRQRLASDNIRIQTINFQIRALKEFIAEAQRAEKSVEFLTRDSFVREENIRLDEDVLSEGNALLRERATFHDRLQASLQESIRLEEAYLLRLKEQNELELKGPRAGEAFERTRREDLRDLYVQEFKDISGEGKDVNLGVDLFARLKNTDRDLKAAQEEYIDALAKAGASEQELANLTIVLGRQRKDAVYEIIEAEEKLAEARQKRDREVYREQLPPILAGIDQFNESLGTYTDRAQEASFNAAQNLQQGLASALLDLENAGQILADTLRSITQDLVEKFVTGPLVDTLGQLLGGAFGITVTPNPAEFAVQAQQLQVLEAIALGLGINGPLADKGTDILTEQKTINLDEIFTGIVEKIKPLVGGFVDAIGSVLSIVKTGIIEAIKFIVELVTSIIGSIAHTGGVAQSLSASRPIAASTFAGAKRYHTGGVATFSEIFEHSKKYHGGGVLDVMSKKNTPDLAHNEIPIIARRNEAIAPMLSGKVPLKMMGGKPVVSLPGNRSIPAAFIGSEKYHSGGVVGGPRPAAPGTAASGGMNFKIEFTGSGQDGVTSVEPIRGENGIEGLRIEIENIAERAAIRSMTDGKLGRVTDNRYDNLSRRTTRRG